MKQHDLFIQNYMEFIEENELEDNHVLKNKKRLLGRVAFSGNILYLNII